MLTRTPTTVTSHRHAARAVPSNQRSSGPIDKAIGTAIRLARLARKLSQTDLGNLLGVTFQQVQKYENGANRVSAARLLQLAEALGIPFGDLVGEAASMRKSGKPSADLALLATCAPARRLFEAARRLSASGRDPAIAKLANLADEIVRRT